MPVLKKSRSWGIQASRWLEYLSPMTFVIWPDVAGQSIVSEFSHCVSYPGPCLVFIPFFDMITLNTAKRANQFFMTQFLKK